MRPVRGYFMHYVVSACLAGEACRYDGRAAPHPRVRALVEAGHAVPVCPEVLGGLSVPRKPCERQGAAVMTADGEDRTAAFVEGAAAALRLAQRHGCRAAILKARSPSCGPGRIYDGSFSRRLIAGDGVFAGMLRGEGFTLYTEEDLPDAPLTSPARHKGGQA